MAPIFYLAVFHAVRDFQDTNASHSFTQIELK